MTNDQSSCEVWQDPIVAEVRKAERPFLPRQTSDIHDSAGAFS